MMRARIATILLLSLAVGCSSDINTVHVTATGEKYHRKGCSYLRYSDEEVTKSEAEARGFTPCSRCYGGTPTFKNKSLPALIP